ncbi:MAG: ABC transporter permease [Ruminococcaceae bacterium]|jgi:simple sugar transport system permease protein|nr:ABC transporter permease [Oscillospiraceae bacterium]
MLNKRTGRAAGKTALVFLISILAAFLVSVLFIAALGVNPFMAYGKLITGAFGRKSSIFEILAKATPLTIMGLGISIGVRGGFSNLGGDGQFYVGAITAVCVGLYLPQTLPAPVIWLLAILVSVISAGLYGGLAGWMRSRFNTNEVIITIMMNYVAQYVVSWLVSGPLQAPGGIPQTRAIATNYYIPKLMVGSRAHWGIVLALVLAVLVHYLFKRTTMGFKIEALGASPEAARYAGINSKLYTVLILAISGAFCGLAGMIEVYGTYYRVLDGITSSFGFTAMLIALLAQLNPFAVILGSVFISVLTVGANSMQIALNVPTSIVNVLQSLIIVFILIMPGIVAHIRGRRLQQLNRKRG